MRLTLSYISLFIVYWAVAQNIPNGNFEQWEMRDHFQLKKWFSPAANVERTTDAKSGKYALKITNTYREGTNGTKGYSRTIDYGNKKEINGLAIDADALSISFWSKYDLAEGDTARFYAVLRNKGTYRGKVDFRFTGTSSGEYVKFSVPIEWNTAGARQIDSVWLYLYSYVENAVDGDGYVIYDDIQFENIGTAVGSFYNQDFEEWENIGVEYPAFWRSTDLLVYDTYTSLLSDSATRKILDDHPKINNVLLIKNYKNGDRIRNGYCFVGTENNQTYRRSFAVEDSFQFLQGYYKYLPDGPDTARILYRTWSGTRSSSLDNFYISEPATEWTFFSIPINYYRKEVPDSAVLAAWSHKESDANGLETKLYLDNLKLVMEPTPLRLSVEKRIVDELSYYPNPTSGLVKLSTSDVYTHCIVHNALGSSSTIPIVNQSIDLRQLADGLYYISLHSSSGYSATIRVHKKK